MVARFAQSTRQRVCHDHGTLRHARARYLPSMHDDVEIAELEEQLRQAQLAADVTTLDRLIDDDLLFAGPDGSLATKSQDLAAHRDGIVRFRSHQPEDLRVRRVGNDVAIASLRTRLVVDVAGQRAEGTYRYTRIWARENGAWRVVGGHVSAVASATPG